MLFNDFEYNKSGPGKGRFCYSKRDDLVYVVNQTDGDAHSTIIAIDTYIRSLL